jgi:hypothetical protein
MKELDSPGGRRRAIRALLAATTAAVTGPPLLAAPARDGKAGRRPAGRWTSEFLVLDPVENFRQALRIQRSLEDEAEILHWYHFIMVAVPKGMAPRAVVRWEGIELSRHRRVGSNRYRLHGHNLSFPRDLATGAFVDRVKNPVTGDVVAVPPMALTSDPGMIASPEGIISLDRPQGPPRPKYTVLRREGPWVKVDAIRVPPDTWPVTFLEMGYEATPVEAFDDASQLWLPAEVSGAYVFPWPEWMQMQGREGHMFAAWSGYKLRSVDELPDEFRLRAEREFPQLLRVDTAQFDRPIEA